MSRKFRTARFVLQRKLASSATYHKRILVKMEKGISGYIAIQSQVERYIQKFSDLGSCFLRNDQAQNQWPMTRIIETEPEQHGIV